eukprot:Phypoly_transcript_09795.p1 GENE.Phypoly_transcript_09795~~Phypoly_transcript_09795.p1  ORF type:complete len:369 (+),score=75.42 Phypoly_transcript_09795:187-1293(+)
MLSPTTIIPPAPPSSPLATSIPKLKLKHFHETLNLGDSMQIIALHEKGYKAQINGTGIELLLVKGLDTPSTSSPSDESPPASSRSLPPAPSRRSSSLPSPSRCMSLPSPSRALDGLDLGDLRLSPRGTNSLPSLPATTLYPRNKSRRMTTKDDLRRSPMTTLPLSPRATQSDSPTSPRSYSLGILSPPNAPVSRSPPRQKRSNGVKPLLVTVRERSPSYNYYPVQGWVLWRRTIGQWERVWLASKKSPTRICFFTSENEDSEERESIKVEDFRSLWAPEEDNSKQKLSQSIHFRLFTEKKTIYLIVQTAEKMRYWIAGLRKLNPDMEIDVRDSMDPASPLSPRPYGKFDTLSLPDDSYGTDDEMDGWD